MCSLTRFFFSQVAKTLSATRHEELTLEQSNIFNQDWLEYPHLRYCRSQMLAGAYPLVKIEGELLPK